MDNAETPSAFQRLITLIKKLLRDKMTYVYGFIAIILLIAGYKIYQKSIKKNKNYVDNKEFSTKSNITEATIYYFETDWCPYCKKAKPEWNSVIESMGGRKINGISLKFVTVDCEDQLTMAEEYKIDSYPSILLEKGNQRIRYDAKVDKTLLKTFINSSLK